MSYKSKNLCKIRTITTFLVLTHDKTTWQSSILSASRFCVDLANRFSKKGYIVQSIRIVTNPFGEYLHTKNLEKAKSDLKYISNLLDAADLSGLRVRFAIGEAKTKEEISLLPHLIKSYGDLCNACVNVKLDKHGFLKNDLIHESALAIAEISKLTPGGEGNFNFTVNFNCEPLIPYFPAGYHRKDLGNCYVVGLETPDLLVNVLRIYNKTNGTHGHNSLFKGYYESMSRALNHHVSNIKNIIDNFNENTDFRFSGMDSSAAPSKDCSSLVDVFKQLGVPYFGASGTVEAASLLTRVFKSVKNVELKGFSGLMLAVTEDRGLAEGTKNADFDIRSLLTYSAVCGIGLDTVPIPGNTSIHSITALMRDTGTMAFRLNKPLTVRLFPVPGLSAGDMTSFKSDDLCNCAVMAVP